MGRKIKIILIGLFIYLISSGISYTVFSNSKAGSPSAPPPKKAANGDLAFDASLPRTEPCPLNGVLYSKQQKEWWEKHRPLGVMIENHEDARPQSGISSADVVYEAVAEGGITRTLAVFYCQDAKTIGPVRSARTYFLDYISEYGENPLYTHVGGANTPGPADALSQIEQYGWAGLNDLNQFSIGFPVFWRDSDRLGRPVATEHTVYSGTTLLWNYALDKRGLTNVDEKGNKWDADFVAYNFKDDADVSDRPVSQTISLDFWQGYTSYSVKWQYDPKNNVYLRFNGGEAHLDKNTNKQLQTKNIIILFEKERNANDGYENNLHLLYGTKGTGNAIIFMDGKKTTGTWSKKDRTSRTIIEDKTGEEIKFDRGQMWFEILPIESDVSVT